MTRKEIKQLLRERADAREIGGDPRAVLSQVKYTPKQEKTAPVAAHKPSRTWMIPAFSAIAVACLMMICIPLFARSPVETTDFTLSRAEEVFSFEMLALGNALDAGTASSIHGGVQTVPPLAYLSAPTTAPLSTGGKWDALAREIHRYLQTAEAMVGQDALHIVYERNTNGAYEDYYYCLTVRFESGEQYSAYYNESRSLFGKSRIEGVFLMNGEEYELRGDREVERDEVEMELRIYYGSRSYISISNERAASEYEYEYAFVEKGRETRSVSIEVSEKGAGRVVELEITKGRECTEYEFVYAADRILCEYEKEEREHELVITVHEDHYLYTFDRGESVRIDK